MSVAINFVVGRPVKIDGNEYQRGDVFDDFDPQNLNHLNMIQTRILSMELAPEPEPKKTAARSSRSKASS